MIHTLNMQERLLTARNFEQGQKPFLKLAFNLPVIFSFKKRKRSKDGLCSGLKIRRCWLDTNRFHEGRFDSCSVAEFW